jgi:Fe-S-cluster-containing dehydrogenase component
MARYGMVIDISRCTACYCCFTACKDEYWENDYPPFTSAQPKFGQFWLNIIKKERGRYPCIKTAYMPVMCQQCADAPCIKAARNGAVFRTADGIVVIDPQKAIGQKQLLEKDACPYGVIYWNEEKDLPQKCTFCAHRLKEGKSPRCVQACPSECMIFGDLDDPGSEIAKKLQTSRAEVLRPELNTRPGIYYIGLHKIDKLFLGGAVIFGDTDECADGVTVTLASGELLKTAVTNNYGNFEFDGLETGKYRLEFKSEGYSVKTMEIDLKTDSYLKEIILVPVPFIARNP